MRICAPLPVVLAMAVPAAAQTMDHSHHQGMAMPDPHAGLDQTMTPAADDGAAATDLPPGNAPAPIPAVDHLADRYWDAGAMAKAREALRKEHGGMTAYQLIFNLAEYQARRGRDGYRWDGEAWVGGDIHRLTVKTQGEGDFGEAIGAAEVQALYSRAIDPYWNLQAGIRHDFAPDPSRTYLAIGAEGLAPYWFDVEGTLFLSDKGDLLARGEAYYDQRITQSLVLQPRIEANLSAQDVPDQGIGPGLTDLEIGVRLRYQQVRTFAPYVGFSWERQFGDTARYSRARGDDTGGFSFVLGVRTWF